MNETFDIDISLFFPCHVQFFQQRQENLTIQFLNKRFIAYFFSTWKLNTAIAIHCRSRESHKGLF